DVTSDKLWQNNIIPNYFFNLFHYIDSHYRLGETSSMGTIYIPFMSSLNIPILFTFSNIQVFLITYFILLAVTIVFHFLYVLWHKVNKLKPTILREPNKQFSFDKHYVTPG
ncbi:hypothetical protein ACJX0J_012905, partial [Zea mays]